MVEKKSATADEEIIERLREHYENGVLPVEPNQKFEELRRQYLENPNGFPKLVAEGLSEAEHTLEKITESDLEGSKLEFHPTMPTITVTVPEKTAPQLMKKLGHGGFSGTALTKSSFKEGSPFYGIYALMLTDDENVETRKRHEESHLSYRELSRSRNDSHSLSLHETVGGETHWKAHSLITELDLLSEILAYGISDLDKDENYNKKRFSYLPAHPLLDRCPIPPTPENTIRTVLKRLYAPPYASYLADKIDDSGVLPDCGAVSRHKAKTISQSAATGYLEGVVDTGVDAFKTLNANLSEDTVKRIITSCGPSKEDVLSGKGYPSPSEELEGWSKHYRKVLANVESAHR